MRNIFYISYFLLPLLLFSCKKETRIEGKVNQSLKLTIAEARNHIKTTLPTNRLALARTSIEKTDSTDLLVNWTAAGQNTSGEYSFVEVPIKTEITNVNLYGAEQYNENENATRVAYSYSTLLIYKDSSNNNANSYIVTYLPSIEYIQNHNRPIGRNRIADLSNEFSGFIEYKNLDGDPKQVFTIEKGNITSTMILSNTSPIQTKTSSNSKSLAAAAASCQTVCIPIIQTVCVGPGGGQGPRDKDQICTTTQIGNNCNTICNGGPTGPPPGGGGGNTGGGTGGSNNPDIKNQAQNPCLKATVDQLLNSQNIEGTMAEILNNFLDKNEVNLTIQEGITQGNKVAHLSDNKLTKFMDPNHNITKRVYSATITIDQSLLPTISKEGVATALIHEVLHAYLDYNSISFDQAAAQHNYIAANYIATMAAFLQNKYGVPANDAVALAWGGLAETKLYQNATSFQMPDNTTVSKEDLAHTYGDYMGGVDKPNKGKPLCN